MNALNKTCVLFFSPMNDWTNATIAGDFGIGDHGKAHALHLICYVYIPARFSNWIVMFMYVQQKIHCTYKRTTPDWIGTAHTWRLLLFRLLFLFLFYDVSLAPLRAILLYNIYLVLYMHTHSTNVLGTGYNMVERTWINEQRWSIFSVRLIFFGVACGLGGAGRHVGGEPSGIGYSTPNRWATATEMSGASVTVRPSTARQPAQGT